MIIVVALAAFLVERLFQNTLSLPVVLVVPSLLIFLSRSRRLERDSFRSFIAVFIYDAVTGTPFGLLTIVFLVLVCAIAFMRSRVTARTVFWTVVVGCIISTFYRVFR